MSAIGNNEMAARLDYGLVSLTDWFSSGSHEVVRAKHLGAGTQPFIFGNGLLNAHPSAKRNDLVTGVNSSTIQLPIAIQRSPLHLLLIEQQIERSHDGLRSPAQLLGKVALAKDHVSGRELSVDSFPVG